jgi:hypothetical protein
MPYNDKCKGKSRFPSGMTSKKGNGRSKNNGKCKCKSRFPSGMTSKKSNGKCKCKCRFQKQESCFRKGSSMSAERLW